MLPGTPDSPCGVLCLHPAFLLGTRLAWAPTPRLFSPALFPPSFDIRDCTLFSSSSSQLVVPHSAWAEARVPSGQSLAGSFFFFSSFFAGCSSFFRLQRLFSARRFRPKARVPPFFFFVFLLACRNWNNGFPPIVAPAPSSFAFLFVCGSGVRANLHITCS